MLMHSRLMTSRALPRYRMLDDTLKIVCPDAEIPDAKAKLPPLTSNLGGYDLLYDETLATAAGERDKPARSKRSVSTWK